MKYIFCGTSIFSVAILEKLMSDFYFPEFVITQPDKPVGRKQIMTAPPVKDVCLDHNIPCYQPEKIGQLAQMIKDADVDFLIVASYGQIIPQAVLDAAKRGGINVHTSLLPEYRGASPIQQAILDGEEQTGITIMKMDDKMDHGDIVFQKEIDIADTDTAESLQAKLAFLGADVLVKVLPDYTSGKLKSRIQNHDQASFTKIIKKADGKIDWNDSDQKIERKVRAYYDWPIAWTILPNKKRLKIYRSQLTELESEEAPGTLVHFPDFFAIVCGNKKLLRIEKLQVEGSKEMSVKDFMNGYKDLNGKLCLVSL